MSEPGQSHGPVIQIEFPNGVETLTALQAIDTIVAVAAELTRLCPHLRLDMSRTGSEARQIVAIRAVLLAPATLPAPVSDAPSPGETAAQGAPGEEPEPDVVRWAREVARAAWDEQSAPPAAGGDW